MNHKSGGDSRAIAAGLKVAAKTGGVNNKKSSISSNNKNPPSPISETKTPPSSPDNDEKGNEASTTPKRRKKKLAKRAAMRAAKHDEYIDYSSSTSVERLARDVETVLRSWHVVDGSDRHASMRIMQHQYPAVTPVKTKSIGTPKTTTPTTPLLKQHPAQTSSVQLLRSEQLSWPISFYLPDGRHIYHSVDLELALWDGDGQQGLLVEHDEDASQPLPLSLRRAAGLPKMPLNVFANFSTLFGIGQHITLTPLDVQVGDELWSFLSESVQQRHCKTTALPAATGVLSGWLQTALNLATGSSQCLLPAFGLWGPYQPQKQQHSHFLAAASILPTWLQSLQEQQLNELPFRRRRKKRSHLNRNYVPPVLTGQCLTASSTTTTNEDEEKQVVFWAALLPQVSNARLTTGADSRLTAWGNVLLRHCADASVALWGARHVYSWNRPTSTTRYTGLFMEEDDDWNDKVWRKKIFNENDDPVDDDDNLEAGEAYRRACQRYALQLMEEAADASEKDPLWGPVQDPLASIHATVTWNATRSDQTNELQPLLALPLKIRSKNSMSTADFIEVEESIEHSILDPYQPGVFVVQVQGDPDCAAATLSATQRCVLAALIRTATLPSETMLAHLLDEQVMDGWDTKAGNQIANQLADRIQAQPGTRALVGAMDWETASDDMIALEEAEEIVQRVLDNEIGHGYPEPPEEYSGSIGPDADELWKPLVKTAPFGRLVSNLFVHMASVRSPSSMVLVFNAFCRELRRRWDGKESLPNMNFVPGLDPALDSYTPKRCFSNVGEKATFAAQVNSSEPDPDDWNCLVGQKMQVFNLCVETAIAEELRRVEMIERRPAKESSNFHTPMKHENHPERSKIEASHSADSTDVSGSPRADEDGNAQGDEGLSSMGLLNFKTEENYDIDDSDLDGSAHERGSTVSKAKSTEDYQSADESPSRGRVSVSGRLNDNTGSVYVEQVVHQSAQNPLQTKTKSLMSGAIDTLEWASEIEDSSRTSRTPSGRGASGDDGTRSMASQQSSYYDADEGGQVPSIFQLIMGDDGQKQTATASVLEMMIGKDRNSQRKGARCPVQGAVLKNGEQVYAPYLRRPSPLTDDLVIQRRMMLARQKVGSKPAAVSALEQLEIAHRFQLPKLSSDMSAFKAANPWSSFEDFTKWYGNPVNPLEEYEEARSQDIRLGIVSDDTVQTSIAKSSEASILTEMTKKFWKNTWDAAEPKTAAENEPLFDPVSTVEMALHYLETLHPATLLCNVLAVNLSAAYFGIVFSAEEALSIPCIRTSLRRLRKRVEIAVNLLSLDAVTSGQVSNPLHPGLSSVEAMAACENACIVLSENEVLLARGRSLLTKFPGKFDLIDRILKASEGCVITVEDEAEQRDILRTVLSQQTDPTSKSSRPSPTLREYLLRNHDNQNPCQLCVRYGNHVKDLDSEGGLLMAITKTQSQENIIFA